MPRKAKPGDRIGRYQIEKEINSDAMAIAYKAACGGETVLLKQYKLPTPTVPWYPRYVQYQQELNYPAIMRAIKSTGFKGFVGQEFLPKRDALTSLREAVKLCNV